MKKIAILYHAECTDGFSGAWAAWKKFGSKADYVGVKHQDLLPAGLGKKIVYLIDFSYSLKTIKKLIKDNKQVTGIDHHISAESVTKLTHNYLYSIDHSGAVLAWMYFHGSKRVPKFLKHVEDIDLWRFRIPHTREIMSYAATLNQDFKTWDKLVEGVENSKIRKEYINQGKIILNYEKSIIDLLVKKADTVEFGGYKTLVVNSPILRSEIGSELVKKLPPIGLVWSERDGKKLFSLRSNGKVDVSKVAEKFGGGGHKAASGFSFDAEKPLPWKMIRK